MAKIRGNQDGPGGRNNTYKIGKRTVTRAQAAKEVDAGKHDGYHTRKINGKKYVVDNPDGRKRDNVNRG